MTLDTANSIAAKFGATKIRRARGAERFTWKWVRDHGERQQHAGWGTLAEALRAVVGQRPGDERGRSTMPQPALTRGEQRQLDQLGITW